MGLTDQTEDYAMAVCITTVSQRQRAGKEQKEKRGLNKYKVENAFIDKTNGYTKNKKVYKLYGLVWNTIRS